MRRIPMRRWILTMMCVVTLVGIGLTASVAVADDEDRLTVPVTFGRGLNTGQAGNAVNHVIIPERIKVNQGGVVHFLVAGFHWPIIYKPGTSEEAIREFTGCDNPPANPPMFVDFPSPLPFTALLPPDDPRFYVGIKPAGPAGGVPPQFTQATPNNPIVAGSDTKSNAQNRLESVGFPAKEGKNRTTGVILSPKAAPGRYLVICNVRGHFCDGMVATVRVKEVEDDDDDD